MRNFTFHQSLGPSGNEASVMTRMSRNLPENSSVVILSKGTGHYFCQGTRHTFSLFKAESYKDLGRLAYMICLQPFPKVLKSMIFH